MQLKDGARFEKVELQLQVEDTLMLLSITSVSQVQILPAVTAQSTDGHLRSGGEGGTSGILWSRVNSPSSADGLRHSDTASDLRN